jgi:hypothetical protein
MNAVTAAAIGFGLLLAGGASASPADFNGRWAVRMVTDSGVCDKSYNYVIAVENGSVRYIPQDSDPAPSVSGSVSPAGSVALGIRKGIAFVNANGQLRGAGGGGTWRLGVLCSGRWTAQKRGPVQAAN